jgi:predicted DNA binding protein
VISLPLLKTWNQFTYQAIFNRIKKNEKQTRRKMGHLSKSEKIRCSSINHGSLTRMSKSNESAYIKSFFVRKFFPS